MEERREGVVVRALASHQCGLGSIPAWYHMWVEFLAGSCLAAGFSLGSPIFRPASAPKPNISNSLSAGDSNENKLRLM